MERYRKKGEHKRPAVPLDQKMVIQLQAALRQQRAGNLEGASAAFLALTRTYPDHPVILLHYGNFLWQLNKPENAAFCYRKALELQPGYLEALENLGSALWLLGQRDHALLCYQKVIKLDPKNVDAHYNLGGAYYQQGKADEAVNALQTALKLSPKHSEAYKQLANTYYEQGRYSEALKCYGKVAELTSTGGAKIRVGTAIPIIPESLNHIQEIRGRLEQNLDRLLTDQIHVADPLKENGYTQFFLAYHGEDDRALQEKYARLYTQSCPALGYRARHCRRYRPPLGERKIRVGFISKNLMNHSIGNTSKGIIALLSRKRFEVTVIFLLPPQDETSRFIAQHADHVVVLPNNLSAAMELIGRLELDILFYQDTGLDPFTFFLAFSRLAPIQCTSFGHPVTTGIPNLDYYISTEDWEPADGDAHYSETLARLRGVASVAYYYKPPRPQVLKPRSNFGLAEADHIYVCPQTLFKFHPEFDRILKGILEADSKARIVLIEGKHRHWAHILRQRFKRTLGQVARHILFLPRQSGADFINLIAISDVMLDTIHFCGFNTTLQAFATATPVVTLPGRFMRGRHTLGFYRKMGYLDLVAKHCDDYVSIAVGLGCDPERRREASRQILERSVNLWQERAVVEEFERFFEQTLISYA
jgi:protein O-GlcNAc transferase